MRTAASGVRGAGRRGASDHQPQAVRAQEELAGFSQSLRCHQSYIVNLDHVEALEESCFQMAGGQVVPVSRNFSSRANMPIIITG